MRGAHLGAPAHLELRSPRVVRDYRVRVWIAARLHYRMHHTTTSPILFVDEDEDIDRRESMQVWWDNGERDVTTTRDRLRRELREREAKEESKSKRAKHNQEENSHRDTP